MGRLGGFWRRLGGILRPLGGVLGPLGRILVPLGPSWRRLGASWRRLGASWSSLGRFGRVPRVCHRCARWRGRRGLLLGSFRNFPAIIRNIRKETGLRILLGYGTLYAMRRHKAWRGGSKAQQSCDPATALGSLRFVHRMIG